jgi:UPF0755 protein
MKQSLPRRRVLLRASLAAVLLALVVAGVGGLRIYLWLILPYRNYGASSTLVEIPVGTNLSSALDLLERRGVIRHMPLGAPALRVLGRGHGLRAGEYDFSRPMTPVEALDKIIAGDVFFHRVTILEGLRSDEIFAQFVRAGFGSTDEFEAAFRDVSLLGTLDPEAYDLEGYLFPDTYSLPKGTTPHTIVAMMVSRWRELLGSEWVQKAEKQGMTVREGVTLASLIQRETTNPDEQRLVSSVFHNRLRVGMRLQCDPTVIYALAMRNRYDGNIRREDLRIDSLYNTYRYAGLTPGPIGNPGVSALRAAAEPVDSSYLYFVSMNTGRHYFSKSLAEHNQAVWRYQKKPFLVRQPEVRAPS